ncbi:MULTISPECIES: rod shape-determining protein RodA [Olivibacter]|jgi:rod shape determining protein RodA|uniref:Cell wall polymerase n=1 Tax=Olivibacter oleidegradans TaxID=760123 RepID=A0ABV6HRI5_9SPHI|nr:MULTISPECIES: rod shape-determining protein RodA [Olivibacter]MDM8176155.1 rod shape-determining protein RodA [Olivibacter sp. 47]QEL00916.1 rod shape-determining protein RodA [Olivibacter sp. LS-1]
MNQTKKIYGGSIDWITVFIWLTLCIIGWFNIRAAVFDPQHASLISLSTNYGKQFIYILVCLLVACAVMIIDGKFYNYISPILYGITLLLLVIVLIVGRNVGGNQAWIPIGTFRLQPSEFAKLGSCLLLARYLSSHSNKMPNLKTLVFGALILFVPVLLIMLQPDTGSALTFFALTLVFYREGYVSGQFLAFAFICIILFILTLLFSQWYIIGVLAILAALSIYMFKRSRKVIQSIVIAFIASAVFVLLVDFAYEHVLQSHQRNRIDVILGKVDDPRGQGYNLNQSKIAIGSGQLFGKGYLQGTQTKYNFVPEQSTDFIFCTVGEEWGFVGSMVIVLLYMTLLLRITQLAERQRSAFARIYGYGVASIFFFHFFINIGMTIGIVPVIGIPLPFLSYGGSSLLSFTLLLFILLKFDSNRKGVV